MLAAGDVWLTFAICLRPGLCRLNWSPTGLPTSPGVVAEKPEPFSDPVMKSAEDRRSASKEAKRKRNPHECNRGDRPTSTGKVGCEAEPVGLRLMPWVRGLVDANRSRTRVPASSPKRKSEPLYSELERFVFKGSVRANNPGPRSGIVLAMIWALLGRYSSPFHEGGMVPGHASRNRNGNGKLTENRPSTEQVACKPERN